MSARIVDDDGGAAGVRELHDGGRRLEKHRAGQILRAQLQEPRAAVDERAGQIERLPPRARGRFSSTMAQSGTESRQRHLAAIRDQGLGIRSG
jgi:hypothetical protein